MNQVKAQFRELSQPTFKEFQKRETIALINLNLKSPILREGMVFDPVKYTKEIMHVKAFIKG